MKKNFFNYGVRIAIIYWLFSFIWIFTSDKVLQRLINDFNQITNIQTIKGVGFITLSALLIYLLIQYYQKQQKSIEKKIVENEERQRLLIENSMDAILMTSADGRIVDINPAAERIFGKSAQEILSGGRNSLMDLTDPRLPEAFKTRQETGSFIGELNLVRKDGAIFPGDVSTQLFTDSEGNVRTSMIIRDVSERKKLEKELAEINQRLKKTLESISDALITLDRDWDITSINQKAAEINKKPPQEFLGNNLWEEWPILAASPFGEKARQSMQDGIPRQVEIHYFIEGQYDVWLDVDIYPSEDGLTLIYRDINEKKHLRESLLESEERLRLAVTSAQQGIYDVNIETGEVVVNDIYAEMLGFDPETFEITVEGWMNRLHPDDFDFVTKYFNDYLAGKIDEYEMEFRLARSDGSYIWILSLGSIVQHDENGKPIRMLGTHTDITERKNAEQEKALFSNIIETSLNEVFVFDAATYKFIQVNKAAIENLGYSYEELMNMTPINIAPEYSVEKLSALLEPLLNGMKKQIVLETYHQRKDGSTYAVEVHLQLQKMTQESLFTAIIQDISERKQAEKFIFEERQRLANIIKGTNVATWEWSVQTGEVIFDHRWAEMLGYTLEELKPLSIETWKNLTNPEDLPKAEALLQKHFSGKIDYYDIEFRMKHKDGHWIWVQDRGRVSDWTEDGIPLVMQGTHQDITQRKMNENRNLEQLEELRRWHEITLGREERIIGLKKEINELLIAQGESPRYDSVL